jgi:hypothetical protein
MLLSSIHMLLTEAPTYDQLYRDIITKINNSDAPPEANGFPSDEWMAGVMASRGSTDGKTAQLLAKLKNNELEPGSKMYRDAVRTKIAFDTMAQHHLISPAENGRYAFPSTSPQGEKRRQYLAGFRNYLSKAFNANKEGDDLTKVMRGAGNEESQKWAASLPEDKKQYLDIYKEMDKDTFAFLKGLIALRRTPAQYKNRLLAAQEQGINSYNVLRQTNLVTSDNMLNLPLIKGFSAFLRDPDGTGMPNAYARLKPFERGADYHNSRSTADNALRQNEVDKRLDSRSEVASDSDKYVQSIMSDLTPAEIKDILAVRKGEQPANLQNLKMIGVVDSGGEFTQVGKAVAASLNVNPDVDSFSAQPVNHSRLHGIRGDRRAERTVDRTTNFKKYLNTGA